MTTAAFPVANDETKPAATPAPAPSRITADADKPTDRSLKARAAAARAAIRNWWGFVYQPMSIREAWDESAIIDPRRIPEQSSVAYWWWWFSNRTDRILLLALLLIMPTFLNGPILWAAVRPTRRFGLYAVVVTLLVIVETAG
jgi:hypothetical protein